MFLAYSTALGAPASDGRPSDAAGPYARVLAGELVKGERPVATFFDDVKYAVIEGANHAQVPWSTDGLTRRVKIGTRSVAAPAKPTSGDQKVVPTTQCKAITTTEGQTVEQKIGCSQPDGTWTIG